MDPTTYASPDEAVEEFAKEIEPKTMRLDSEIGAGMSMQGQLIIYGPDCSAVGTECGSVAMDMQSQCMWCHVVYTFTGEFGTVFRGIWKETPKKQTAVAIKTLKVHIIVQWVIFIGSCML